MMINTPYGNSGPRVDGYEIRTAAVSRGIPCITTVQGAAAAVQGIEAMIGGDDRGAVAAGRTRGPAKGALVTRKRRHDSASGWPRRSPGTARCASGSTRTRGCWPSGGSPTTRTGWTRFAMSCVEALAGHVAVVKPQSAFFERHGSAGIAVLERVLDGARGQSDAVAARRQARRHRLDDGRLRGRLPGHRRAAGRRRCHALALPRFRLAGPGARRRYGRRAGRVRAGPDVQPGGRGGAARDVGGSQRRPGRGGRRSRPQRRGRAARRRRSGRRGHDRATASTCRAERRRCSPPGSARRARGPADIRARFAAVRGIVLPAAARSVLRHGPDPVDAARGGGARCATSSPPRVSDPTRDRGCYHPGPTLARSAILGGCRGRQRS